MTGIELPFVAAIGLVGIIAGAGGSYAVTKKASKDNHEDIIILEQRLSDHEKADDKAFKEIMRALGRIEGTLDEMNRSK